MGYVFSEKWDISRSSEESSNQECYKAYKCIRASIFPWRCKLLFQGFSTRVKPLRELTTNGTKWKCNDKVEETCWGNPRGTERKHFCCVRHVQLRATEKKTKKKKTEVLVGASPVLYLPRRITLKEMK